MNDAHSVRHRRFGRLAALPMLLALLATVLSTGVVGAASGTSIVRGIQREAGSCRDGGYLMTGSLVGCWWIDTFESKTDPDKTNFRATGTEHFTGCLGATCGTFLTTFTFTAKMDGPWLTSAESTDAAITPCSAGLAASPARAG